MSTYHRDRSRLCEAIASLTPSSTLEEATAILEPIVETYIQSSSSLPLLQSQSEDLADADGITPLMVACDKASFVALEYLGGKLHDNESVLKLIGQPCDTGPINAGGNQAAHHAASAGFIEGIDWLVSMSVLAGAKETESSKHRNLLHLLSQQNANGDTPIMMACAGGQKDLIAHWIHQFQSPSDLSSADVRRVFEMRNASEDSACSFACGFGFTSIVRLLVEASSETDEGIISASHNDLDKCRAAASKMDALMPMVLKKGNEKEKDHFKARRQSIEECIAILESACNQLAQKAMSELLAIGEDTCAKNVGQSAGSKKNNKKKQGRKKDKKKKSGGETRNLEDSGCNKERTSTAINETKTNSNNAWRIHKNEKQRDDDAPSDSCSPPRVVTLQDGSVISWNKRTSYNDTEGEISVLADPESNTEKSIHEMLRERCSERRIQSDVETIMDSLCLDPSMLLLTNHGMALNLSPCQLDAIESILNTQLRCIHEAKQIQARIRGQTDGEV